MNIANQLTIARIWLAVVCVILLAINLFTSVLFALIVFIAASFTDLFDGYFARRRKEISDLGRLLDPIADKALMLGVFFAFAILRQTSQGIPVVSIWFIIPIAAREIIVTAFRLYHLNRSVVLSARRLGKLKTVLQISSIIFIFVIFGAAKSAPPNGPVTMMIINVVIPIVMSFVVFITLLSGIYDLYMNRNAEPLQAE